MKRLPLALVILLSACSTAKTLPAEALLTREEVLNYLDGKELPLAVPGPGEPKLEGEPPTVVLKRDQITVLDPEPGVRAVDTAPWTSKVTFLYAHDGERYAVEATVDHKLVENQRAFFGFRPRRVAKQ